MIRLRHIAILAAVFLAGVVIATVAARQLRAEPSTAGIGSGAGGCGDVQVSGRDWLGGQGVDVHSNGVHQTKDTSCAYNDREVYNLAANPPIYGFGWQCVELVNRLYATRDWFPKLWLGSDTNHGAKWLYTYAERGKYAGLTAHANGSGYQPVPGDMIVHTNGDFGHVSLVDRVEGSTLHAVEQNNSPTGRATYAFDPKTGAVSRPGSTIAGYVHALSNRGHPPATTRPAGPTALSFKVIGSCTTAGGELRNQSSGFTPSGDTDVSAWYPDRRPYPVLRDGKVGADGSVSWRWPCKGDPPGTYGTQLVDLSTGRQIVAYFVVSAAPVAKLPVPPNQQPPPVQPAPPGNPPQPPPSATRSVTIFNKVTNGAAANREDDQPAYLSTITRNTCRLYGCKLDGTDMWTGARLTVVCQVQGNRNTNGQDNNAIDDNNPILYTSSLWYGARWSDGRFGYISEVWVQPGDRGGLGLPGC